MPTTYAIPNGATQFAASTWTGDSSSSRAIANGGNNPTGVTFQPNFVWLKNRTASYTSSNALYDSVRGAGSAYLLSSNSTGAEGTLSGNLYGYLSAFNSNGFTAAKGSTDAGYLNQSPDTYVGWQWKATGSTVSNTSGSVTSTVDANTTAGFSIATFTTSTTGTIGHGLGVAPSMIIMKSRNNTSGWSVYHKSVGNTGALNLQTDGTTSTSSDWWQNTSPTSSVWTIGANLGLSGWTWVAYCFAEIAGYSKFGSYVGNNSTDGPFVYCGFRPKFVMVKCTDNAGLSWMMIDSSRNTYNVCDARLFANSSIAETTGQTNLDLLSNGFKCRVAATMNNGSGYNYIYAAFAENPFKYANAR